MDLATFVRLTDSGLEDYSMMADTAPNCPWSEFFGYGQIVSRFKHFAWGVKVRPVRERLAGSCEENILEQFLVVRPGQKSG